MNMSIGNPVRLPHTQSRRQSTPKAPVTFAGSEKSGNKKSTGKWLATALTAGVMALGVGGTFKALTIENTAKAAPVEGKDAKAEKQVVEVNDVNFEKEVLQSDVPVLVNFGAPWCGYCVKMQPELKKLANDADLKDKIKVVHINIDDSPKTTAKWVIDSGIPDTRFFQKAKADDKENSQVNERHVGYRDKDTLKTWVKKHMDKK